MTTSDLQPRLTVYFGKNSELSQTLKLAGPIILSQVGQMLVGVVDTMLVGRLGANQLAAAALSNSIFFIGLVLGLGFSWAITPLVGAALGRRDEAKATSILAHGTVLNFSVGVVISLVLFGLGFLFEHAGQTPEVARLARLYFWITVASLLPVMVFQSFKQFADGATKTTPGMVITIAGNVVNIALNYALIWGFYFIEPMGLNGSAIATLIARWLMAAAGMFYFLRARHFVRFRVYLRQIIRTSGITFAGLRELASVGAPLSVQSVLEVAAFSLGAVMMGWVGATELAAHQTAINTASLTFMVMSGIAAATTIRVSGFYGAKNYTAMKRAANVSMMFAVVCMIGTAAGYIFGRNIIPFAYVDDPAIVEVAARLFVMAGIFQIFDGVQVVALGALRGVADVRTPMLITVLAYLVLSLPISYVAAFVFGLREIGIWLGYVVGLLASSSLFVLRFRRFCRELEHV